VVYVLRSQVEKHDLDAARAVPVSSGVQCNNFNSLAGGEHLSAQMSMFTLANKCIITLFKSFSIDYNEIQHLKLT